MKRMWCVGGLTSLVMASSVQAVPAGASCAAQSESLVPTLVELYTSEGCDACPPADQWLSQLKGRPGVQAVAFHVDYWDRLGWSDPYAQPAFSQRQVQDLRTNGARFAYTPQVVVDGQDWPRWPQLPAQRQASTVQAELVRQDGQTVRLSLHSSQATGPLLLEWWRLEDGLSSDVKAGENKGRWLRHDHVALSQSRQALPAMEAGERRVLSLSLTA